MKIKELVWNGQSALTPFGDYALCTLGEGHVVGSFNRTVLTRDDGRPNYHTTIDEAKAAAQAHFENSIRSALVEPEGATESAALICERAAAEWKKTADSAYELDHNEAQGWSRIAEARAETAANLAADIRRSALAAAKETQP